VRRIESDDAEPQFGRGGGFGWRGGGAGKADNVGETDEAGEEKGARWVFHGGDIPG
jgi:hypothetical protein